MKMIGFLHKILKSGTETVIMIQILVNNMKYKLKGFFFFLLHILKNPLYVTNKDQSLITDNKNNLEI